MNLEVYRPYPEIADSIAKICERYDMAYWMECDEQQRMARDFFDDIRKAGWLAIAVPEAFGGAGLGIAAAATMVHTIASHGGGWTANGTVMGCIFSPNSLVVHGSAAQKKRILPSLVTGDSRRCFAITEPDAGLDTTRIRTRAVRDGDRYIVNGEKVWISGADIADYMMILVRTRPIEETPRPADGLSLFCTKIDRSHVTIQKIKKHGYSSMASCHLFINDLPVSADDMVGEEGKGFRCLFDNINPERVIVAACAVGVGQYAIKRAAEYAKERIVFGRPIGMNQAVQHPLARCWMELQAAEMMLYKAAHLYDAGLPCGAEANAAKFMAAEAGEKACRQAMQTLGGFGYAREFHIERLLREVTLSILAPVGQNLILSFLSEKVLGLPKSY